MSTENYLAHYGKKGMRWGVRNTPSSTGSSTSSGVKRKKKKSSAGTIAVEKLKDWRNKQRLKPSTKAKKIHQLSDVELTSGINRLKKEVEYRNLTADLYGNGKKNNQSQQQNSKPESIIRKALGTGANKAAEGVGTTVGKEISKKISSMIEKKTGVDISRVAPIISPKNPKINRVEEFLKKQKAKKVDDIMGTSPTVVYNPRRIRG